MSSMRTAAAAACAAALFTAQPILAAERQSAAFAGATVRVPFGGGADRKASARLRVTSFHDYRDVRGAVVQSHRPAGLELGFTGLLKPAVFVGGRPLAQAEPRLHGKGKTTWIVVGGVVVLAIVVLASVASAMPTAGPPKGAFD
jgi:hypothetical protein